MKSKQSKNQSKKRTQEPSSYKVETGIPIPNSRRKRCVWLEYARNLKPDQSILVTHVRSQTVSQTLQPVRKEFKNRVYVVRAVEGGTRVFRTK